MICSGLEDGRTEGPFKRKHYVTQGKAASGNLKEGNRLAWVWRVGRKRDVCGWMGEANSGPFCEWDASKVLLFKSHPDAICPKISPLVVCVFCLGR